MGWSMRSVVRGSRSMVHGQWSISGAPHFCGRPNFGMPGYKASGHDVSGRIQTKPPSKRKPAGPQTSRRPDLKSDSVTGPLGWSRWPFVNPPLRKTTVCLGSSSMAFGKPVSNSPRPCKSGGLQPPILVLLSLIAPFSTPSFLCIFSAL